MSLHIRSLFILDLFRDGHWCRITKIKTNLFIFTKRTKTKELQVPLLENFLTETKYISILQNQKRISA